MTAEHTYTAEQAAKMNQRPLYYLIGLLETGYPNLVINDGRIIGCVMEKEPGCSNS